MWLFRKRVDVLQSSTDDLEQYDQRNNLILSSTTDWVSDDDLEETKNAILSDIDVQVTANDAQSCHRIGQSSSAFWTETKSTVEKYLKKKHWLPITSPNIYLQGNTKIFANENLTF